MEEQYPGRSADEITRLLARRYNELPHHKRHVCPLQNVFSKDEKRNWNVKTWLNSVNVNYWFCTYKKKEMRSGLAWIFNYLFIQNHFFDFTEIHWKGEATKGFVQRSYAAISVSTTMCLVYFLYLTLLTLHIVIHKCLLKYIQFNRYPAMYIVHCNNVNWNDFFANFALKWLLSSLGVQSYTQTLDGAQ